MSEGMDPSLMQDFLTESRELIEQLDADLVTLETLGNGPSSQERLNSVFRALHTIKGAASFLGLTAITHFAHAAEDALNRLRKGEIRLTPSVMDAMLKSVDVVRNMIDQLAAGEIITPGPEELIALLHQIAEGKQPDHASAAQTAATKTESAEVEAEVAETVGLVSNDSAAIVKVTEQVRVDTNRGTTERSLVLPAQKQELLSFMVDDLRQQAQKLDQALHLCADGSSREQGVKELWEIAGELAKTAEFFELNDMTRLTGLLARGSQTLQHAGGDTAQDLVTRLEGIRHLIELQAPALERSVELLWPLGTFIQRVEQLLAGQALPTECCTQSSDPVAVLRLDGVLPPEVVAPAAVVTESITNSNANHGVEQHASADVVATIGNAPASKQAEAANKEQGKGQATNVEQTIRVEVGRLEALLNLVGQLVLTKNRMLAVGRKCREFDLPTDFLENVAGATSDLDRLTSELQVGVMRTRMQPLAKLFERYPRVIRDISRALDKKINLEIVGKETEVDKSVLELLGDPLIHILRNSADHGVEKPEIRKAAGKSEIGTVRLAAEHQGSHVRVEISDDGKGLDREVLAKKAIEKGLVTAEQAAALTNEEVFRFIFAAGFSTAERVTDLSGRGVGMDVVRTNIAKLNGVVNINSTKGKGTTIEILIPLTVAIMPAMVVGVGKALYCVPLQSIIEIVKPDKSMVYTVSGQPVMRLRDSVLPLIDLRERLRESANESGQRFAVVIGVGGQRAGLVVDRLIGQQEIVIKPLDDQYTNGGPFSGATIREDGDVSLILDVIQLIRQAPAGERLAA